MFDKKVVLGRAPCPASLWVAHSCCRKSHRGRAEPECRLRSSHRPGVGGEDPGNRPIPCQFCVPKPATWRSILQVQPQSPPPHLAPRPQKSVRYNAKPPHHPPLPGQETELGVWEAAVRDRLWSRRNSSFGQEGELQAAGWCLELGAAVWKARVGTLGWEEAGVIHTGGLLSLCRALEGPSQSTRVLGRCLPGATPHPVAPSARLWPFPSPGADLAPHRLILSGVREKLLSL